MMISGCSTKNGSVALFFCYDMSKKTIHFEVKTHILDKKYEKVKYTEFPAAVDAYNVAVAELEAVEG